MISTYLLTETAAATGVSSAEMAYGQRYGVSTVAFEKPFIRFPFLPKAFHGRQSAISHVGLNGSQLGTLWLAFFIGGIFRHM